MTSFKFHFRPSDDPAKPGNLFIRMIHKRKYRELRRGYKVFPEEWDPVNNRLVIAGCRDSRRVEYLRAVKKNMRADLVNLGNILKNLAGRENYTVNDILRKFNNSHPEDTLLSFTMRVSEELKEEERHRTARAYRSAARKLTDFTGRSDMRLCEINSKVIRALQRHLLDNGLQMNTVSFYMRNLRAIYYRAVKAKLISRKDSNPFEDVYTGVYETRRRALTQKDMNSLSALESSLPRENEKLRHALMYFMFAYHSRGMSFVDLANLKRTDIKGDLIIYRRRKTGFFLQVKITAPMKKIIKYFRHKTRGSQYLFPILSERAQADGSGYDSALNKQNRNLKVLASMAGIEKGLSTHVARHTWATFAKRMGYGIMLISEGLGHRDPKVTSIYLASFERSKIDELSAKLSRAVYAA